jgi:hypothetical protein
MEATIVELQELQTQVAAVVAVAIKAQEQH